MPVASETPSRSGNASFLVGAQMSSRDQVGKRRFSIAVVLVAALVVQQLYAQEDLWRALAGVAFAQKCYACVLVSVLALVVIGTAVVLCSGKTGAPSPLDAYTLDKKLGEGAYGTVYRASKAVNGETVRFALKIMQVDNLRELNDKASEGVRLMSVNHPNVVKVHEPFFHMQSVSGISRVFFDVSPYQMCIAQELCSSDLEAEIRSWAADLGRVAPAYPTHARARPPWPELIRIFEEIVEGVDALHAVPIIHRDLKPGNIFISCDHRHVKVGDLGSSVKVDERSANETELGTIGTPGYMAPEVWCADTGGGYSTKADNYSLGCIMADLAYPTAMGGWALEQLLKTQDYYVLNDSTLHVVAEHPAVKENAIAVDIITYCCKEKPEERWSVDDMLEIFPTKPRTRTIFAPRGSVSPAHTLKVNYEEY